MTAPADITVNLDEVRIDPAWALRIPVSLALRRRVLPFALLKQHVHVACSETPDAATPRIVTAWMSVRSTSVKVIVPVTVSSTVEPVGFGWPKDFRRFGLRTMTAVKKHAHIAIF